MPGEVTDSLQVVFPGSVRHLGEMVLPYCGPEIGAENGSVLMTVLAIVASLIFLMLLGHFLVALPSMLGSLVGIKEVVNLENSARLSRDRNFVAFGVILPTVLIGARYSLYPPLASLSLNARILWTTVVFLAYVVLRRFCVIAAGIGKKDDKTFHTAVRSPYTFFAMAGVLMCFTAGVCAFGCVEEAVVRYILWWEMAMLYFICLFRKTQIFINDRGVLAGFLYLCILEILPTGLLTASAFLL